MPWYINILVGIIMGGVIFNAKMRKGFMGFLDGLVSKKSKKEEGASSKTVMIDGKKYRLEEDDN